MAKNKLLRFLSVPFLFCLSACDLFGNNGLNFNSDEDKWSQSDDGDNDNQDNKYDYKEHVCQGDVDAGYLANSTQYWYKCIDSTCRKKVDASYHNFGEPIIVNKGSSCDEMDVIRSKCVDCGYEKIETSPNVHKYGDIIWDVQPTCTEGGYGYKICENCNKIQQIYSNPLGHKYKILQDDGVLPHIMVCQNEGCDYKYFAFAASEVTSESKKHLTFDADGGVRFIGQPIGNSIEIPVDECTSHTPIWDKNQTGDYFEFIINLSHDTAEYLGDCRLFCDAQPAMWMYENNLDFWARAPYESKSILDYDWTPGLYIDEDHPGHLVEGDNPSTEEVEETYYEGEIISDFRYALYVDDQFVPLDKNMPDPVRPNNLRDEYLLPYNFHLHEGTNKIRLHMAGGYISTFYNFRFEPINPDYPDEFTSAGSKISDLNPVENRFVKTAYELYAEDCDGQNAPKYFSKDTRLGKGVLSDTWDISGIKSGNYDVYIKGAYGSAQGTSYWSADQNVILNNDNPHNNGGGDGMNGARYYFQIDDFDSIPAESDLTYFDSGLTENDEGNWTKVSLGQVAIPHDAKTFKITNAQNGYTLWIYGIRLVRRGDYCGPYVDVTFTNGKSRIECENYAKASLDLDPIKENDFAYISVNDYSPTSVEYHLIVTEEKTVKLVLKYRWWEAMWGNYGAAEVNLDATRISNSTGVYYHNIGETSKGPTNVWRTDSSDEFILTPGEHIIQLTNPIGCFVDWDYFELVEVTK